MEYCPITGLERNIIGSDSYSISFNGEKLFIKQSLHFDDVLKNEIFIKNKHLIAGAILNKQLGDKAEDNIYWFSLTESDLEKKVSEIIYPKTPRNKLDNLFKTLFKMQKSDGEKIDLHNLSFRSDFYYKHFFKSKDECFYYFKILHFQELIYLVYNDDVEFLVECNVTFKGLNYYLELTEKGDLSNKCFIAMSFGSGMEETRKSIKTVVQRNGFEPILIDEQNIESTQTINDAIIAALRSSKFCIADFTQQKDGVYFESGFAAGLGKPVIYTCHKEHFDKTHFDTNHFPHIIYSSLSELNNKLEEKINAWIKQF